MWDQGWVGAGSRRGEGGVKALARAGAGSRPRAESGQVQAQVHNTDNGLRGKASTSRRPACGPPLATAGAAAAMVAHHHPKPARVLGQFPSQRPLSRGPVTHLC